MQRDIRNSMRCIAVIGALVFCAGCSEDVFVGTAKDNRSPEVWLSSGPVEGDTTSYQVHFYWGGWDPDGVIDYFEYVIVDGNPIGFDPEDTTGIDKWSKTTAFDSIFSVQANDNPDSTYIGRWYTRYDKTHTFFIRAVDMKGSRSRPMYRSFTAWTLAPYANIERPEPSGMTQLLSRVITFGWSAKDPIDYPTNTQDPDSVRFLCTRQVVPPDIDPIKFDIVDDMNKNPWRYEKYWEPWIYYRAPNDSGRMTIIGDDEILQLFDPYMFVVQAKDEAGAVSAIFERDKNVRLFIPTPKAGPLLLISEPYLGGFKFVGTEMKEQRRELPPNVTLNFKWEADASAYGGEIRSYRYGWNVQDLNNPDHWDSPARPDILNAPPRKLYSGEHFFYVEAVDNAGTVTLATILLKIVPFTMERNLLWVDDYYSTNFQQTTYTMPTESEHDMFWLDICRRANGFVEERDVYDCTQYQFRQPEIRVISHYKNIIWTYSSSANVNAWKKVVVFTPEGQIAEGSQIGLNYLALFLAQGGHLWTLGFSDRGGGLASMFMNTPLFPVSFKFDMNTNDESDTSGVNCMGYKDYCVKMIDKVMGSFRPPEEMPKNEQGTVIDRKMNYFDVMTYAYRADDDAVTAQYPALPQRLELWSTVTTCPGCYFAANGPVGGFNYLEIYDPEYYMVYRDVKSRSCFHPMYRMKARSTRSVLNDQAIAIWVTKYQHVVPQVSGGVAAKSFHFGFPLWFFNRQAVNEIVTLVFTEWQIIGGGEQQPQ